MSEIQRLSWPEPRPCPWCGRAMDVGQCRIPVVCLSFECRSPMCTTSWALKKDGNVVDIRFAIVGGKSNREILTLTADTWPLIVPDEGNEEDPAPWIYSGGSLPLGKSPWLGSLSRGTIRGLSVLGLQPGLSIESTRLRLESLMSLEEVQLPTFAGLAYGLALPEGGAIVFGRDPSCLDTAWYISVAFCPGVPIESDGNPLFRFGDSKAEVGFSLKPLVDYTVGLSSRRHLVLDDLQQMIIEYDPTGEMTAVYLSCENAGPAK